VQWRRLAYKGTLWSERERERERERESERGFEVNKVVNFIPLAPQEILKT
jgi:hypothetical protein